MVIGGEEEERDLSEMRKTTWLFFLFPTSHRFLKESLEYVCQLNMDCGNSTDTLFTAKRQSYREDLEKRKGPLVKRIPALFLLLFFSIPMLSDGAADDAASHWRGSCRGS